MRKLLDTIINFGASTADSPFEKRRIKTVNLLNLVITFFLLFGFLNYPILKDNYNFFSIFLFLTFTLTSLLLSKFNLTTLSFFAFTLNVNIQIFYINKIYPLEVGSHLYYFPLIVSVVLLNNPSAKDRFVLTHFIFCVCFFAANLIFDLPSWQINNLAPEQMKKMWVLNIIISAAVTATISFLLTRLIIRQNKEIIVQNDDLLSAKEEINVSLKEKEVLLAELHHRVKNNLAIISGLLNLQEDSTQNKEAKQIIADCKTRILSMSLVHKMLFETPHFQNIDLNKYVSELLDELFRSYHLKDKVNILQDIDLVVLPVNKSIPLGLILNEIVTNSIKYVYSTDNENLGIFDIRIKSKDPYVEIIIKDNGKGFPKDFNIEDNSFSLGIFLIKSLSEQIDGEVMFSNDNGARIDLKFLIT